jgi:hypothetical protein
MAEQSERGDRIRVGNITSAQGVAIGSNARAEVVGHNLSGEARIDSGELRLALEELFEQLDGVRLSREQKIEAQTATGLALTGVSDKEVKTEPVTTNLEKVGKTLREANVVVEEGSSLWESVKKLASLVGPIVGGARVVSAWFGLPLP